MDIHGLICLLYIIVIVAVMVFCGLIFCPVLIKIMAVAFTLLIIASVFEFVRRFIKNQSESYNDYSDDDNEMC